ncbi:hypothetical protein GCM10011332_23650 [Terasakiella brassicae]|uniref:Mobilization protein n=1 Tax=Terasakiella brassicae TaxID=1634917 RepID=A0A917C3W1_9PROT|nr:hypothetical protein [Terasakiella brassicae]GGF68784.1 hypothetical protein GCM10011332_23650 [Terasakiella brassicae]
MTQRTILTSVRLSSEEKYILQKAALAADMTSLSGYIRKSALWSANNSTTQISYLVKEQADEVIMEIKMLHSLLYLNPTPNKYQTHNLIERIEQKIRSWLK